MAKQTENYELPLELPGADPTVEAVFAEAMQKIEAVLAAQQALIEFALSEPVIA